MKRVFVVFAALAFVAGMSTQTHAQSGAEANAWANWCRQQGGQVEVTSSNPICHPGGGGGSGGAGFTANQQAMLDVAGQLGYAIGAAIRQSFVDSQRQAAADAMRRRWLAEQTRQRAQQREAEQSARNAQLLASMRGTVGAADLRPSTTSGSSRLRMRTANEMFNSSASAVQNAYAGALTRRDAAQSDLEEKARSLATAQQLVAEAERNALDHPSAEATQTLNQARGLRDQAERDVVAAQAALDRANTAFQAEEDARLRALNVNPDTSVVDLRGASSTPTLVTSLPQSLPRLQEVENSPGRERWTQGMQAVINHDWARAADLFAQARALDPSNQALINAQELAEFTRDRDPDAALRAQLRQPNDADLYVLFPETAAGTADDLQTPRDADLLFLFNQADQSLSDLYVESVLEEIDREAAATNLAAAGRREIADNLAVQALIRLQVNLDVDGAIVLLDSAARQAPEVPNYASTRDALIEARRYNAQRMVAQPMRLNDQSNPGQPRN